MSGWCITIILYSSSLYISDSRQLIFRSNKPARRPRGLRRPGRCGLIRLAASADPSRPPHYCEGNHPVGSGNQSKASDGSSSQSEASGGSSQPSGCSGEASAGSQSSGLVMTRVIRHFNTLGIDLRTFHNQMTKGDAILPPFKELFNVTKAAKLPYLSVQRFWSL